MKNPSKMSDIIPSIPPALVPKQKNQIKKNTNKREEVNNYTDICYTLISVFKFSKNL